MREELPDINLLPDYEKESNTPFYFFIGLALLTIMLFALLVFYYFSVKSDLAEEETKVNQLTEEVTTIETEMAQMEDGDTASLTEVVTFLDDQDVQTSRFIETTVDLLPPHSYLGEYIYDNQQAELMIHFETLDAVADYTSDMNQSAYTIDALVDDIQAFEPDPKKSTDEADLFSDIPRYEANFTIDLNKHELQGEEDNDE